MKSKKLLSRIILGGIIACLCSCGSTNAKDNSTDAKAPEVDYTGKTTLTFIGHASVKIVAKDGSVLYIDPNYYAGDYSAPADAIIITHRHEDHLPYYSVKLKETGTQIDNRDALVDGKYKTFEFGPFTVEAVAAGGNPNHDVKYCVGYLVSVDGFTIYHAGDTSMIEQMKALKNRNIDYAMYPIDGVFNMDAVEATEVANLVGAKFNIPIHENDRNGTKKSDNFTPQGRLILEYGQTIILE